MSDALQAGLRPKSTDALAVNVDIFPFDAFEFDDPNRIDEPTLGMKAPWKLNITEETSDLEGRVTVNETDITANGVLISSNEGDITNNATDITAQGIRLTSTEGETTTNTTDITSQGILITDNADDIVENQVTFPSDDDLVAHYALDDGQGVGGVVGNYSLNGLTMEMIEIDRTV